MWNSNLNKWESEPTREIGLLDSTGYPLQACGYKCKVKQNHHGFVGFIFILKILKTVTDLERSWTYSTSNFLKLPFENKLYHITPEYFHMCFLQTRKLSYMTTKQQNIKKINNDIILQSNP